MSAEIITIHQQIVVDSLPIEGQWLLIDVKLPEGITYVISLLSNVAYMVDNSDITYMPLLIVSHP